MGRKTRPGPPARRHGPSVEGHRQVRRARHPDHRVLWWQGRGLRDHARICRVGRAGCVISGSMTGGGKIPVSRGPHFWRPAG
jgi:hypothetical protein